MSPEIYKETLYNIQYPSCQMITLSKCFVQPLGVGQIRQPWDFYSVSQLHTVAQDYCERYSVFNFQLYPSKRGGNESSELSMWQFLTLRQRENPTTRRLNKKNVCPMRDKMNEFDTILSDHGTCRRQLYGLIMVSYCRACTQL